MQVVFRSLIGIILLAGLTLAVGCASTPSAGGKTAGNTSMDDFLAKPRATTMLTR